MKTAILTILLVASVSSLALAADKTDGKSGALAVEKIICNKSYIPATGHQSPNYQAGVDVDGKPVASADLNSVPDIAPDYVEVPMTIDLAKRMNLPQVGAEAEMPVANLKIFKDGKVEYNGQDISSHASTLCGVAQKSQASLDVSKVEPAAGQDQMIAAPSVTVNSKSDEPKPDMVAPENTEPQAGSVAASTTSPPPVIEYKIQQGTANR